jgi:hypothetical protein
MSEILTYDNLVAGNEQLITEEPDIIAGGQSVLKRGTALGMVTATGKLALLNSANTDGSQTIYGILGADTDTTNGDVSTFVYLTGEFNQANVIFGGTDTYQTHKDTARTKGIFFKFIQP